MVMDESHSFLAPTKQYDKAHAYLRPAIMKSQNCKTAHDAQEPILALRRQLAVVSGAEGEAGLWWLQQAKLCRVSGHFEAATTASLEALARQVAGAGLERAKLLWDMDKPHRAIISLQEVCAPACLHASK